MEFTITLTLWQLFFMLVMVVEAMFTIYFIAETWSNGTSGSNSTSISFMGILFFGSLFLFTLVLYGGIYWW
jgi:hypothetical protein